MMSEFWRYSPEQRVKTGSGSRFFSYPECYQATSSYAGNKAMANAQKKQKMKSHGPEHAVANGKPDLCVLTHIPYLARSM